MVAARVVFLDLVCHLISFNDVFFRKTDCGQPDIIMVHLLRINHWLLYFFVYIIYRYFFY